MDNGLLLTKRPSSPAVGAAAAAPAGLDRVSIGNYKGVMLCNRPFAGVPDIASKKQRCREGGSTDRSDAFVCGTVAKPWGIGGGSAAKAGEEKSRVLSRLSKKDGALTKHRRWLKRMQEERDRLEEERREGARRSDERKKEFMDKQAKIRSVVLEEAAASETRNVVHEQSDKEQAHPEVALPSKLSRDENVPPSGPENDSISKPAWALTESAAKDVDEAAEAREEEDLLAFVDDLDFEQYSHDLELKVLMKQVKERIQAIQKEKNVDEARLRAVMDSEVAAIRAETFNSLSEEDLKIIGDDGNETKHVDDDVRSIAESVRSEGSVSCIHSQRSMEALVAKSRERMGAEGSTLDRIAEAAPAEISMEPPKLITHSEDDGARLAETKSLNKLPFKNRNPAL